MRHIYAIFTDLQQSLIKINFFMKLVMRAIVSILHSEAFGTAIAATGLFLVLTCLSAIWWACSVFVMGEDPFIYNVPSVFFSVFLCATGLFLVVTLLMAGGIFIDKITPARQRERKNITMLVLAYAGLTYYIFTVAVYDILGIFLVLAWYFATISIIFTGIVKLIGYIAKGTMYKQNMA